MKSRRSLSIGALITCILLASCSAETGEEIPSSSAPVAEPAVPTVQLPLNASGQDPCGLVAQDRMRILGVSSQSARDFSNDNSKRCSWTSRDGSFMIDLVISTHAGLRFAYSIRDSFLAFIETDVDGYPALNVDPATSATCSFWVGIADDQSFSAGATSLSTSAPPLCEKARALASEVLDALRK